MPLSASPLISYNCIHTGIMPSPAHSTLTKRSHACVWLLHRLLSSPLMGTCPGSQWRGWSQRTSRNSLRRYGNVIKLCTSPCCLFAAQIDKHRLSVNRGLSRELVHRGSYMETARCSKLDMCGVLGVCDASLQIRKHPSTNEEIRSLCTDLQVLGRSEFKSLLKWRLALRKVRRAVLRAQCTHASCVTRA